MVVVLDSSIQQISYLDVPLHSLQFLGTSHSEYVEVDVQVFQRFQNFDFANVMYLVYLVRVCRVSVLRQSWLDCPQAPQTG